MTKMLPFSKMLWRSRRPVLGVLMVMMISPIIFFAMDRAKVIIEDLSDANRLVQKRLKENVEQEKGTGCNMPQLNPFSEEIANFSRNLPIVRCHGLDWVNCFKSECKVSKEILKTTKEVVCIYRNIIYVDDRNFYLDRPMKVLGDEIFALNRSDHVKIECTGKSINSPGARTHWTGYKAGFRPVPAEPIPPNRKDSYNVMILCFDSTSRNSFIRNMQNSYKYLTDKLNAVILNSYNIVADGTTGALYPILTGKPEEEHIYTKKRGTRKKYVYAKKFIFHMLRKYGYRTAYFEDMPWIGSLQQKFNWFRKQPADHYIRTLMLSDVSHGKKWYPGRHCIGATPQYQMMMNLADEFLQLDGKKFCFTLIVDKDYENFTVLPTADETLLSFLKTLAARKTLEDTLVLIMGDHGSRYSSIRDTYRGKMEERLPLMAILLPQRLKKLRPKASMALRHNQDVLTTPFDIHATILDVLDLKNKSNNHKIPGTDLLRAISLLDKIPTSRSCGEAGVMPHWCACSKWYNVSRNDPMYEQVSQVLAEYIDSVSQEMGSLCAERRLISTEWVLHQRAKDHLSKINYFNINELNHFNKHSSTMKTLDEYYQAKIIMSPGKGVFEGTMIYNSAGDYYMITQRDISRVSAYGEESECVRATHPHLSKYCFCKDRLANNTINRTFNNE